MKLYAVCLNNSPVLQSAEFGRNSAIQKFLLYWNKSDPIFINYIKTMTGISLDETIITWRQAKRTLHAKCCLFISE